MEKYRIIQRDIKNKTILLESTEGRTEVVNEGVFKDTFIKMRDAFVQFVKRGNRIVAKIGGKLTNSINSIYNTLLNKQKYAHVFLSKNEAQTASSAGVSDLNDDFEEYENEQLKRNNINIAHEIVGALLYRSELYLKELNNEVGKIDEAYLLKDRWDILPERIYRKMFPHISKKAYTENDDRNEYVYQSEAPGVRDYPKVMLNFPYVLGENGRGDKTASEIINEIDRRAKAIFNSNWEITDVNNPGNIRNEQWHNYKPIVIAGASGIGKTSLVKEIRKKYGVSMVCLAGNNMNEYSLTSPTTETVKLYKIGKDGTYETDENGKVIELSERTGVSTVLSTNIPAINIDSIITEANISAKTWNVDVSTRIKDMLHAADDSLGKGILFIDEITRMPTCLLDSLMDLFQTGEVGNQRMGTKWMIVGALNPAFNKKEKQIDDNLYHLMKEPARRRRFDIYNFIPNFEEFMTYGKSEYEKGKYIGKTKLHPLVIKFLDDSTRQYHMMNVFYKVPENSGILSSNPALWEELSQAIYDINDEVNNDKELNTELKKLRATFELIIDAVSTKMSAETQDVEGFLEDEFFGLSDDMCKQAWDRPLGTDVKDANDRTFVMHRYNRGMGLSKSIEGIKNQLYNNAPFVINGKGNKEMYEKNKRKYLLNIYNFINTGFNDAAFKGRGKQLFIDLADQLAKDMYSIKGSEGGKMNLLDVKIDSNGNIIESNPEYAEIVNLLMPNKTQTSNEKK